jgi:hypothetical protein
VRHSRLRVLLLFAGLVQFSQRLTAVCSCFASDPPNYPRSCVTSAAPGTNPALNDWNTIFQEVSKGPVAWGTGGPWVGSIQSGCGSPQQPTQVTAVFPCELLRAIAMQESSWIQFCVPVQPPDQAGGASRTLITSDCGYGAFQITYLINTTGPAPWDRSRVASDPFYNAATGALFLADNWASNQCVGDRQPQVVEDWYIATWKYGPNQQTGANNPNNPNLLAGRGVYDPSSSPTDGWTYQEKVWGWMEHPPSSSYWAPLLPAYPDRGEFPPSGNSPPAISEPHCAGPTDCSQTRLTHVSACLANNSPQAPLNLSQRSYGGITIPVGGTTNAGTLSLGGIISSPLGRRVRFEVEVKNLSQPFTGQSSYASGLVSSGTTAAVCVLNLNDGLYHWRGRTIDEFGQASQWLSFGNNSELATDFGVSANVCAICAAGGASVNRITRELPTSGSCGSPLLATLSAAPTNGQSPLTGVSLTATASGSATGTINYTFYCDRLDAGTDVTTGWIAKYDGVSDNPKTAASVCSYSAPGTYTSKVIVERGGSAAEARATITVLPSPTSGSPSVTTSGDSNVTQGSAALNLSVTPNGSDTLVWFDWDTSTNFANSTAQQTVSASGGTTLISMTIGGLICNTTYYFRARAQNAAGSANGNTLSFTTNGCGGTSQTIELVADPSFERGNNAWWVASPAFYINHTPAFPNPRTGSYYAFLSNPDGTPGNNLQGGVISPQITIPSNALSAQLSFWHSISTQETSTSTAFDTLQTYLVKPANQLSLLNTLSNLDSSGTQYRQQSISVASSFFGQTVQIFFAGFTDASLPTVFRLDDVSLQVTLPVGGSPSITTTAPDQVTASTARLNMVVNPNGASTQVWFNIAAGNPNPINETEHVSIGADRQTESVSITAFGLQCGTLYYVRANATNTYGSVAGSVLAFTTASCPVQTPGTIVVNDLENGGDWPGNVQFRISGPAVYGASSQPVTFSDAPPGTYTMTYLSGGFGVPAAIVPSPTQTLAPGGTITFTFIYNFPESPIVDDPTISNITPNGVTFSGSVSPNDSPTSVVIQYGTTANYGSTSNAVNIGNGVQKVPVTISLSGLSCNTLYHYSLYASNAIGYSYSPDATFTTGACPSAGLSFYTLTPCRLLDTRPNGALGAMSGSMILITGKCGIPSTAKAVSMNVTAVTPTSTGYVSVYPAIGVPPSTDTVSFSAGQVRAAATVVGLNSDGTVAVFAAIPTGQVNVILDVNGYFQ